MKIVAFLLSIFLAAQMNFLCADKIDLVKLQKKEKKRLANLKKQKKRKTLSVNNKNLKSMIESRKGPYSFIEVKQKRKIRKPAPEASEEGEGYNKTEGYWKGLKRDLEVQISELTLVIRTNENEMARLQRMYMGASMLSVRLKYEKEYHSLRKKVNSDKIRLKNLEKDLTDLPDRARKAGVPPGWIR